MAEMTVEHRARQASALLKNPLFKDLLADIRDAALQELAATRVEAADQREKLFLSVRALDEFPGILEKWRNGNG